MTGEIARATTLFSRVGQIFYLATLAAFITLPCQVRAQYPDKPIRLIVPYVAGGTPDYIVRVIEPILSDQLGQRIVVDNRPGAGGLIGTEQAAKAAPDGYTLVVGTVSNFGATPVLRAKNLRYDVMRDFVHFATLARSQLVVVTHPAVPANNIKELIAFAKRHPDKLNYASSGSGTTPHILAELFKYHAGLTLQHVPYKGGPQAWTAVISGEVGLVVGQVNQAMPHINSGRIRPHAVFGDARSPALPEIPTFSEAGVKNLDIYDPYWVALPAGSPIAVVNLLNKIINYALSTPDVKARLAAGALSPMSSTPEETVKFVRTEVPRWADAVRISGATLD